jgi:hypothetical protein
MAMAGTASSVGAGLLLLKLRGVAYTLGPHRELGRLEG